MCFSKSTLMFVVVLIFLFMMWIIYVYRIVTPRKAKLNQETPEQILARQEKEEQQRLLQQEWEDQKDGYNQ